MIPSNPANSTELKSAVPALNPNSPMSMTRLRPKRSLKRPHLGDAINTVIEETPMMLVIWISLSQSRDRWALEAETKLRTPCPQSRDSPAVLAWHKPRRTRDSTDRLETS